MMIELIHDLCQTVSKLLSWGMVNTLPIHFVATCLEQWVVFESSVECSDDRTNLFRQNRSVKLGGIIFGFVN